MTRIGMVLCLLVASACGSKRGRCEKMGQRGGLFISTAEELADLEGRREVPGALAICDSDFTTVDLTGLERIGGILIVIDNPRLTRIELSDLVSVGGDGRWSAVERNPLLTEFELPRVEEADTPWIISDNAALARIAMPCLEAVRSMMLHDLPSLAEVDLSAATTSGTFALHDVALAWLELPLAQKVAGVSLGSDVSLAGIRLPALRELGHIEVRDRTALPAFDWPATATLTGGLTMQGSHPALLAELLAEFAPLVALDGDLRLVDNGIRSLEALATLERVGGTLGIEEAQLQTLAGLASLREVGGSFLIEADIDGDYSELVALESIGGQLSLDATRLRGFPALRQLGYELDLSLLDDVDAFPSLAVIEWGLTVAASSLESLALPSLAQVGRLNVSDNLDLQQLSLPALTTAQGELHVTTNPALQSLDLSGLASVGGDLVVAYNESLPQCEVTADLSDVEVGGVRLVSGNGGCP